MENLKNTSPVDYLILRNQDEQLALIQEADKKYTENNNVDEYIVFWEAIWSNGGLKFEGSKWHFVLADLYIKEKRYDDALKFLKMLKKEKPNYREKAISYIEKVEKLKAKSTSQPKNRGK